MAEFGPDAELDRRRAEYDAARSSYESLLQESQAYGEKASPAKRAAMQRAVTEAAERAERLRQSYNYGASKHPAGQFQQILSEADGVAAPKLTTWDWVRKNPSPLEAVPLTEDQRRANARLSHILKRVHEAANAGSPQDPFHWGNYRGPMSGDMAEMETMAAEAYGVPGTDMKGYPEFRRQLESPYQYRPWNRDQYGQVLPLEGQAMEAFRPLSAVWSGVSRFKDNFAAGGAALSEGRPGDAAKAFAYAVPNLISPAFHVGGEGMDTDWREYVEPGEATAMDMAAEVPLWMFRGLYPRRPGRGLASIGTEDRIRQYRDELLGPLLRQAARKHHPDVGGSAEAMKRANAAFDAGDVETLRQMAY